MRHRRRELRRNFDRPAPAGMPPQREASHDSPTQTGSSMPINRISLYRASLLADNLGIRLCLAAVLVMPSALVFLLPVLALVGAPDDALLPGGPMRDASGLWAALSLAIGIGFAAAWLRIVFAGGRLLRRPGPRRFVTAGLALGIVALAIELIVPLDAPSQEGAGWLLVAALAVSIFLLAGTLGLPRTDRWRRI
jgi:hypothetical protein